MPSKKSSWSKMVLKLSVPRFQQVGIFRIVKLSKIYLFVVAVVVPVALSSLLYPVSSPDITNLPFKIWFCSPIPREISDDLDIHEGIQAMRLTDRHQTYRLNQPRDRLNKKKWLENQMTTWQPNAMVQPVLHSHTDQVALYFRGLLSFRGHGL